MQRCTYDVDLERRLDLLHCELAPIDASKVWMALDFGCGLEALLGIAFEYLLQKLLRLASERCRRKDRLLAQDVAARLLKVGAEEWILQWLE